MSQPSPDHDSDEEAVVPPEVIEAIDELADGVAASEEDLDDALLF
jgi:hypothetical protein